MHGGPMLPGACRRRGRGLVAGTPVCEVAHVCGVHGASSAGPVLPAVVGGATKEGGAGGWHSDA
eukprot:519005-Pyramimonas_sp.AAC.1